MLSVAVSCPNLWLYDFLLKKIILLLKQVKEKENIQFSFKIKHYILNYVKKIRE